MMRGDLADVDEDANMELRPIQRDLFTSGDEVNEPLLSLAGPASASKAVAVDKLALSYLLFQHLSK